MGNKSNRSITKAREEASFRKGEYRGLDLRTIPIRPSGLEVLGKPSRMGGILTDCRSIFTKLSSIGEQHELKSDGSK